MKHANRAKPSQVSHIQSSVGVRKRARGEGSPATIQQDVRKLWPLVSAPYSVSRVFLPLDKYSGLLFSWWRGNVSFMEALFDRAVSYIYSIEPCHAVRRCIIDHTKRCSARNLAFFRVHRGHTFTAANLTGGLTVPRYTTKSASNASDPLGVLSPSQVFSGR